MSGKLEEGSLIGGRYRLGGKLGSGGMGTVWRAQDEKLLREVAVKLLTPRDDGDAEKALTRFKREAMAVARLRSPHIVEVHDYGVEDGQPYTVMELLSGRDLRSVLKPGVALSLKPTTRIVTQIAKALTEAHASGVVHRDLKPGNVFLVMRHGEESVKVFDFGIAKTLLDFGAVSDVTTDDNMLGTPRYMSPEQLYGSNTVDERTDVWGLGVIAFRALTGRMPFEADSLGTLIHCITMQDVPRATALAPDLPAELDDFFEQALAKQRADRFASAHELASALAQIADVSISTQSKYRPIEAADLKHIVIDDSSTKPETETAITSTSSVKEALDEDADTRGTRSLVDALVPGKRRWPMAIAALALGAIIAALLLPGRGDDPNRQRNPPLEEAAAPDEAGNGETAFPEPPAAEAPDGEEAHSSLEPPASPSADAAAGVRSPTTGDERAARPEPSARASAPKPAKGPSPKGDSELFRGPAESPSSKRDASAEGGELFDGRF